MKKLISIKFLKKVNFRTLIRFESLSFSNSTVVSSNIDNKKFKVYTKTGDKGTTSLIGGMRKSKDDDIFDVLGDIDELNSYIGLCCSHMIKTGNLHQPLIDIQNHLYHVSAYIASQENEKYLKELKYEDILENLIDEMEEELPPLKHFINPGGCVEAAHLQVARTIARRVERKYVTYSKEKSGTYLKFFNRLSDFFFVASRYVNHIKNLDDKLAK